MPKGVKLSITKGMVFGRLSIVRELEKRNKRRYFLCICECGKEHKVRLDSLTSGSIVSCGCYNLTISKDVNRTHGMSGTRLFKIWCGMRSRCQNTSNTSYANYGGRGISVSDEWQDFETFKEWAHANGYKDDLTIERKDVDKGYCPENCTWITMERQRRNTTKTIRMELNGEEMTLRQWAKRAGIHSSTLCNRLKKGLSLEDALSLPKYWERRQ